MITQNNIHEVSLKVNSGSGVLVKINQKSFVITAIHCLSEESNNIITNYNRSINYDIKNYFYHKNRIKGVDEKNEDDIVLIQLECSQHNLLVECTRNITVNDSICVYGFPHKGATSGTPILDGKILTWHDSKTIETLLSYTGSNSNCVSAIGNILGWSGSGLFKKIGRKLYLIGILKELQNEENPYQAINCIAIKTILEVMEYNNLGTFDISPKVSTRIVLFTPYTNKSEPYYLIRAEDNQFVRTLDINNIWIFGASGQGKTALIHRNLIQQNIKYIFCDLSPIIIDKANDVLEYIINSIDESFDDLVFKSKANKIITIVDLLKQINVKKVVIVIDEMSVSDNDLLEKIAESFLNLVTYYTNSEEDGILTFIISTREKPQDILINKNKASDYFEYICCDISNSNPNQILKSIL